MEGTLAFSGSGPHNQANRHINMFGQQFFTAQISASISRSSVVPSGVRSSSSELPRKFDLQEVAPPCQLNAFAVRPRTEVSPETVELSVITASLIRSTPALSCQINLPAVAMTKKDSGDRIYQRLAEKEPKTRTF